MPNRPKVVVTAAVDPACLAELAPHADIVMNDRTEPWPRGTLLAHCRDAFGMIAFMPDRMDAATLVACPSLRIVAGALKGFDNFDVDACTRRGVWLTVVPDLLSAPTADLAIGLLLALSRNMLEGDRLIRGGNFTGWRPVLYGSGIAGVTVGILGMGAVGREIARRLTGFDARLVYFDDRPLPPETESRLGARKDSFDAVTAAADILILALPLTDETHHIIDRAALQRLKPGCLLINPARGSLVDEEAVADAIATGCLGGYAADAFACEDIALSGHPAGIAPRLLADRTRTVLTPHLGSAVDSVRREIVAEAARNVLDCIQNRWPRGAVNAPAGQGDDA